MKFNQLTIGKRIAFGFGIVLTCLCIITLGSYFGVDRIVKNADVSIAGNQLDAELAQMEIAHLSWAGKVNALITNDEVQTLDVETDHTKCAFGKWLYGEKRQHAVSLIPSLGPMFDEIEKPHQELHATAIEIGEVYLYADYRLNGFFRDRKSGLFDYLVKISEGLLDPDATNVDVPADHKKCSFGIWLHSDWVTKTAKEHADFAALVREADPVHQKFHESIAEINSLLSDGLREEATQYFLDTSKPAAHSTLAYIEKIIDWQDHRMEEMEQATAIYAYDTIPALKSVQESLHAIRAEVHEHIPSNEAMLGAAQNTRTGVSIVGAVAIVLGVLLALQISRRIINMLKSISGKMETGSEQVANASERIASMSGSLAEGASEQASSIEETSASLEELAAMTQQNADNSSQADQLMHQVNGIAQEANNSMINLNTSMDDISRTSEETSKIIKSIDEIAFQTNLLALNAAVEAARAGEAGAGFAVVADEVRNLAMRAADAAKNTADQVDGIVKKIHYGTEVVQKTNEDFGKVTNDVSRVGELVSEIAAASDEQARGIHQVNDAVTQMDKVTQQNAASAEEFSAASEEMDSEAKEMRSAVDELSGFVGTGKEKQNFRMIKWFKNRKAAKKEPIEAATVS